MTDYPGGPEEVWDRFIDALDRAGQAAGPAGVVVPTFATHALGGRRFGDLSKGRREEPGAHRERARPPGRNDPDPVERHEAARAAAGAPKGATHPKKVAGGERG